MAQERRRGRPPRIDREKILAVARTLPPGRLTMQAVADRLGVHRNAVHYYVADREGLMKLLAHDAVVRNARDYHIPEDTSWQGVVRAFATWLKDNYLAAGELLDYYRYDAPENLKELLPVEHLLKTLIAQGFTPERAGRTLIMTVTLALGYARDVLLSGEDGTHPQSTAIAEAIPVDNAEFALLRRLADSGGQQADPAQFAFSLETMIRGLEGASG